MSDEIHIVVTEPARLHVVVSGVGPKGEKGDSGDVSGSAVASVNGHSGTVVLAASDVGADTAGAAAAAVATEATARTAGDSTNATAAAAAQATANASLPKSGGTMTGPIVLDGDPTANLNPATRQWVLAQITSLINGAPGALDTLKEIADQLASDESAVSALTSTVAGKLSGGANLGDLANAVTARANLGLASAATHPSSDFDVSGAAAAAQAASQPIDSDLTAIAALTTTAFGRSLLALADAAALLSTAGAASAADLAAETEARIEGDEVGGGGGPLVWHEVTSFSAGCASFGEPYATVAAALGPDGNVYLDGLLAITSTFAAGATLFSLPLPEMAPPHKHLVMCDDANNPTFFIELAVKPSGEVVTTSETVGTPIPAFDGCFFPLR